MITPIRALTIEQICERKEDLLVSNDDIHKLAKHVKEQASDECIRIIEETVWKDTDMLVESIRELKGEWHG